MKKTRWFPVSEKPVRVGWYECIYEPGWLNSSIGRWWDGHHWLDEKGGSIVGFGHKYYPGDKWRGLTKEAK
ncbi:hypothetical protein [Robbsia andropogonis]|uniref:hypothetical protein n=1 Tax=Robbsia andropogonis TaxID=28092 RepID=UPI0004B25ABC|nr:hypothetical protein [Robbsia andropogonis]